MFHNILYILLEGISELHLIAVNKKNGEGGERRSKKEKK